MDYSTAVLELRAADAVQLAAGTQQVQLYRTAVARLHRNAGGGLWPCRRERELRPAVAGRDGAVAAPVFIHAWIGTGVDPPFGVTFGIAVSLLPLGDVVPVATVVRR